MTEEYIENTREYVAAKELEHAINSFGWKPDVFAKSVRTFHRTLQQELFRTVIAVIKEMAEDDFGTDDRNQASHDTAKAIVETGVLDDAYLPYV